MTRRAARKRVLDCLYENELEKDVDDFLEQLRAENQYEFIVAFSKKVLDNISFCDGQISKYSKNWDINRICLPDKLILRMGITEICLMGRDKRIAINEAVELAKKYSTEKSPGFINGILDKVARDYEIECQK